MGVPARLCQRSLDELLPVQHRAGAFGDRLRLLLVAVVKGPKPEKYVAIEAPPSGTPLAWATFRWQIRRAAKDTGGEMTATVFSPDSGQVRAVFALGRQERIRVSGPHMPEAAAAGQDIALAVDAACLDDGRFCVAGTNTVALTGTLDRCMNKESPRLSMELHGGVVAGRELSLGFIMCNHAMASEVRGSLIAFACENDVPVHGWRCDHVVRHALEEGRRYAVPAMKCQASTLLKWPLPDGTRPKVMGALILILNEAGQVVDSICTEKPCNRTGICG